MLLHTLAPIFVGNCIVIRDHHDVTSYRIKSSIQGPHLAAYLHLGDSQIRLGLPAR